MIAQALLLVLLAGPQEPAKKGSYRLPFEENKTYLLTQGNHGSTSHTGYCEYAFDFGMPEGTKVCAARGGKVVDAHDDLVKGGTGGGNQIKIDHGDNTFGMYFHLKHKGCLVQVGDLVLQGDLIGLSGATGNVTGPHLHFQVDQAGKSSPVAFEDVEKDGGLPKDGGSYTSKNTPGIPAETKDKLSTLLKAAKLAEQEGAWGLVYMLSKKIGDERLAVKYPPQDDARQKVATFSKKVDEAATSKDVAELFRARKAFEGAPAKPIAEALDQLKADPAYNDAKSKSFYWEHFYKGLKEEVEGHLAGARTHYKNILSNRPDDELKKRAEARLEAVESRLKELLSKKPAGKAP